MVARAAPASPMAGTDMEVLERFAELMPRHFRIGADSIAEDSMLDDELVNAIGYYATALENAEFIGRLRALQATGEPSGAVLELLERDGLRFYVSSQFDRSERVFARQADLYRHFKSIVVGLAGGGPVGTACLQGAAIVSVVCLQNHWVGLEWRRGVLEYYDGLGLTNLRFPAFERLVGCCTGGEVAYRRAELPRQTNWRDCGPYCLLRLARGLLGGGTWGAREAVALREWAAKMALLCGR